MASAAMSSIIIARCVPAAFHGEYRLRLKGAKTRYSNLPVRLSENCVYSPRPKLSVTVLRQSTGIKEILRQSIPSAFSGDSFRDRSRDGRQKLSHLLNRRKVLHRRNFNLCSFEKFRVD